MAFKGKVALITGGASGMGKLMAMRIAGQGAKVAIVDMNREGLEATAALSPHIIPFYCDVTNLDQVREIVSKVEAEMGPIDRLAHCAAIMPGGILHETTPDGIHQVMRINYTGLVNMTSVVLPLMRKRNSGDFIVIGSIAGVIPSERFGAYGATKAATNFFMRVLILENKDTAIRFQLVCPSAVNTPLINQAVEKGPEFLKRMQNTGKNIATPEFIIDSIEKSLERNKQINYPGLAFWGQLGYRLFPKTMVELAAKMM